MKLNTTMQHTKRK